MSIQILNILKMVLLITLFTIGTFPFVKRMAIHANAIDIPNERKVHKVNMPLFGGLMIFFGFIFGYVFFSKQSTLMNAILISGFILVITGMLDDIKPLSALKLLIGQVIAASIVVFYGGLLLNDVAAFGIYLRFGILAYPITIIFIVALINMVNLIDGLDGLASGISAIFFLTIGILAIFTNRIQSFEIILSFIMLSATLGFLFWNFNPAKIFMGGVGSMFLGFMIAVICLLGFKSVTLTSLIIPLSILAIPILDTSCAIIRRIIRKKPIYKADKEHLHHQLLKKYKQKQVVLIIYSINILFSIATIIYFIKDKFVGTIMYLVLLFLGIIFIFTSDIIFERNNIKNIFKRN